MDSIGDRAVEGERFCLCPGQKPAFNLLLSDKGIILIVKFIAASDDRAASGQRL
jgi:hypothetical protein